MSYILNIETATKNCSVALAKEGKIVLCKEISELGYSHAEKLHVFIEDIVAEAQIAFQDIKAIAISKGPGSYTGLRIGVSAAKGLCYGLDIPLIAIDTLTILANQIHIENGLIIPMIDARRMEVYSAVFNSDKEMIRGVEAQILTETIFDNYKEEIHFIGDSNQKAQTILTKSNFIFHDQLTYPSSKEMCELSYKKYEISDFEDVAYFEPYYLKDFMMTVNKNA